MKPYSIQRVASILDVPVHTLRYWESEGLIKPDRTAGGQRRYSPAHIQALFQIKRLLKDELFTIAGARKVMEG
jgi:DNA-binding transcriptional MerR regulator